jgi:hypothetical protein
MNLVLILFLTTTIGVPTGILSVILFPAIERVPVSPARRFLPAIGRITILILSLCFYPGIRTPGQYEQVWAFMDVHRFFS